LPIGVGQDHEVSSQLLGNDFLVHMFFLPVFSLDFKVVVVSSLSNLSTACLQEAVVISCLIEVWKLAEEYSLFPPA